jgi:hypothetical protein
MSAPKKIHQLTKKEFNDLKKANLLQVVYPNCDAQKWEEISPQPLKEPDFTKLKDQVMEYFEGLKRGETPKDAQHYIYEAAVEAVYGEEIWDFINEIEDEDED